ncbi:MAG: TonB-dependent receptor [Acidobacteria bacterium]|nr:TonB-dependent receptor [Acidobacteriota bacterium]
MANKLALSLALVLAAAHPLLAQEVSAGITGRVTDPSGAAIVAAKVTAKDVDRGTVWPTDTNAEGVYAFPRIPAGTYELRVEAPGFRPAVRPGIRLEINQRARLDVQMELGTVTETLEVKAETLLLQTETTQVGSVISGSTNVNLPLNGRNFVQLTLLAPGSTTTDPAGFTNGQRTVGGGRPYVNGNRKEGNNFLLDGIDNNHASNNFTSYQPSVDAIQEFKMITNNASAEFGNFQGGIVNVTIKSGTNGFHGSVFEFLRNDKLNANAWSRNWQGLAKAALRHNVFGGAIGGPLLRDRLFFFTDYQGIRRANPGAAAAFTVIPPEFRQGNFARLLTERNTQLYNPLTTDAAGLRQPFPNNQIPASMIDPVARNLFALADLYPAPLNSALRFNSLNTGTSYVSTDQGDIKIDAKLSRQDDFSARYSNSRQDSPSRNSFPLLFNGFYTAPFQAGVLNWTRVVGPALVNELRVGVNRVMFSDGNEDKGVGNVAEKLGIARGNERGSGLMALQFTGGLANDIGNTTVGLFRINLNNTYHYADNLTIIRGRHMMKTGFQWLRQQMNVFFAGNNGRTGFIRFTGQYSGGPNANAPVSRGFPEADFVLGYPTRLGRGLDTGIWGQRKNILGGYFQDDWRATDRLTLNLGLRWEYHSPLVEVADRQSNFAPFTGALQLAGKDGNSRGLYNGYKRDWQPRIGFAWTPGLLGKKTVLRGAYSISSFMEGTGVNLRLPLNPPFATEFETIYEGRTQVASTTAQGLTVLQAPQDLYRGANIRLWDPNTRPAHVQQWSFLVERQLTADTVLWAGYVGQHGTHLIVPMPYFQRRLLPDGRTERSPFLAGNPLLAGITQISGTASDATQRYDGLQVSLHRRLSAGFEYQLSYTWSHGRSDDIGYFGEGGQAAAQSAYWQNLYDRKAEWGPTYFDAKQMFTYSAIYDLPLGRGKKLGTGFRPLADKILGNWQLGGIVTFRSGFPLTINALDRSGTVSRGPRADRVANGAGKREVGPGKAWFDTGAFKQPVAGTLGNSGVGVVRGPGLKNLDLSVQKSIPVAEGKRFEFRGEFFNLSNTPIFNVPVVSVQSATFGEITNAQGERNIQFGLKFYF